MPGASSRKFSWGASAHLPCISGRGYGIGNGKATAFWHDVWLGEESIADKFQALYSHCKEPKQSVHTVISGGLRHLLVPRLTAVAAPELQEVNDILSGVALTDAEDRRSTPFAMADGGGALITSGLYKMIKSSRDQPQQMDNSFWRSCAPPPIQFFACLVLHGRLQCKTNLFKKKIVDNVTCEVCGGAPGTTEHLLFFCPFSATVWQRLGVQLGEDVTARDLLHLERPESLPPAHFDTFVLLCCWQLWKRRNGFVFRQESMSLLQFMQNCKLDARACCCRLPRRDMSVSDLWCSIFSLAM